MTRDVEGKIEVIQVSLETLQRLLDSFISMNDQARQIFFKAFPAATPETMATLCDMHADTKKCLEEDKIDTAWILSSVMSILSYTTLLPAVVCRKNLRTLEHALMTMVEDIDFMKENIMKVPESLPSFLKASIQKKEGQTVVRESWRQKFKEDTPGEGPLSEQEINELLNATDNKKI